MSAVEALEPNLAALPELEGKVLIVPGAFFRNHPGVGGDGLLIRQIASEFGFNQGLVPVKSKGAVTENNEISCKALEAEADGSAVLGTSVKAAQTLDKHSRTLVHLLEKFELGCKSAGCFVVLHWLTILSPVGGGEGTLDSGGRGLFP